MEVLEKIRANLSDLPISFQYLGALKSEKQSTNYNQIRYKPATIAALQTNSDVVGVYHKPISRIIEPVLLKKNQGKDEDPTLKLAEESISYEIEENLYFRLFSTCIPVKGASRSIIIDTQRQFFNFIPNSLYDLVTSEPKTFAELILKYGQENKETISSYFHFLLKEEYGTWFSSEELSLFPPLSTEWQSPFLITNSILDFDENSNYDLKKVLNQLDQLGCEAVQLRFFCNQNFANIQQLANLITTSRIKSLDIYVPYNDKFKLENVINFAEEHQRLNNFVVYKAPYTSFTNEFNNELTRVIFTEENISSEHHCGIVKPDYFLVNIQLYLESMHFNNCLNRKISVDKQGQIKNCPSMEKAYGLISDTTLKEVLDKGEIQKKWTISKDQIEVCKDCEFRYICTDCRAYTTAMTIETSKPSKCRYNPYAATWE
jgi:SPASM domain peptide maturase of grasp-with-spasm system